MPKRKPDETIVHRIEFQDSERELLSSLTAAFAFNRVATPIVNLLNDVTGTVTVLALLGASGLLAGVAFTFVYDPDAITDPIEQFVQQLEEAKDRAELVGGAVKRGPLWGLIDMIEMYTGTNLPDFGGGYEPPAASQPVQQNPDYNDPSDLYLGIQTSYTSPADVWGGGLGSGSLSI
tara:strand:- start:323 stop:853 length:531 start_codon:yes stop_codon:yes gene_type:complete